MAMAALAKLLSLSYEHVDSILPDMAKRNELDYLDKLSF